MRYAVRYTPNIENDIKRGWSGWQGQAWKTLTQWWNGATSGAQAQDAWEKLQERREKYQEFDTPMDYICDMHEVDDINELDWVDVSNELEELIKQDLRWDDGCQMWRLCDHDGLSIFLLDAETEEEAIEIAETGSFDKDQSRAYIAHGKIEIVRELQNQIMETATYLLKVERVSQES